MDDQFRRKIKDDEKSDAPAKRLSDDDVIDLYSEFNDPLAGKLDPEVEELKRLAQSDALRAYGWIRRTLTAYGGKFDKLLELLTPKRLKLARNLAILLVAGGLVFRFAPGIYSNLTEEQGILGESETASPDFATLIPGDGLEAEPVYDPETESVAYQDTIGGLLATVSQQVMPTSIKAEQGGVEKLALSLSDKSSISRFESDKGQIYVVEAQNRAQTVIFGFEEVLVFIRSSGNINPQLWVDYVNALELSS